MMLYKSAIPKVEYFFKIIIYLYYHTYVIKCYNITMRLGKYRHYKNKDYRVVSLAKHSETLEDMVVYNALYGDEGVWVRPLKMFTEKVVVNGKEMPRFLFIED